ncbi:MMPL family transporter [Companilactobacillus furfuricola]|uniref:MMPL family transporter n=1 Tax=Companilactobacillus furfuricola TaxID=1462575 RepID=UPI000F766B3D|nr:MMPL family transporter [Companilactobacillus furfuricola]
MQNALNRFGKWAYNHKMKMLLSWIVIVVALVASVASLGSHFNEDLKISGVPSTDIQKVLKNEFHQSVDAGTMTVLVENQHDRNINNTKQKTKINKTVKQIQHKYSNQIKSITSPYQSQSISKDKTTGMISITFKKDSNLVSQDAVSGIQKKFRSNLKTSNTKVAFSGNVLNSVNFNAISELIGMIIAFILMLILFKSFVTAGMPIISALAGLVSGLMVVVVGTNIFTIASVAQTLTVMISLAVGIDYALFIINRYKSELKKSHKSVSPDVAMGRTLASAGSSVLFAGVTVIIALVGLAFIKIDFLTQIGLAAAIGVIFAVLSALTLLPALISLFSKFIKPSKKTSDSNDHPSNFLTKTIADHPITSIIVSLLVLIGFMIPTGHMRLGMPSDGSLPTDNTRRQAYDITADKFGKGANSTIIGVVKLNTHKTNQQNQAILKKITTHISKDKAVDQITPVVNKKALKAAQSPEMQQKLQAEGQSYVQQKVMTQMQQDPSMSATQQQQLVQKYKSQFKKLVKQKMAKAAVKKIPVQMSKDNKYAMFVLMPKDGPESVKTEQLTQRINSYSQRLSDSTNTNVTLTGTNAVNIDISEKLNNAIPVFTAIVMVIAFILLMIMFRSFLIPLFAMIGFGLSVFASFGITTLIIQDGVMKSLFGISVGAPILAFLPVIMIGVLFGLAMDYEVFMVSRIRETYLLTGDTTFAVKTGLVESGPVIITAALIMIAVFGSFSLSSDPTIKSIGIALASGVFFDAFFVRLIFVPATIKLLGKANWYFPGSTYNKF